MIKYLRDFFLEYVEYFRISRLSEIRQDIVKLKERLTEKELKTAENYKNGKRFLEYIGGRALLKESIIELFKKEYSIDLNYRDITTIHNQNKKPHLKIRSTRPPPYFSISHSQEYLFCAADTRAPVGVDVEKVNHRFLELKKEYTSGGDIEKINEISVDEHNKLLNYTKLWSSKEALVKLLESNIFNIFVNSELIDTKNDDFILSYKKNEIYVAHNIIFDNHSFSLMTGK